MIEYMYNQFDLTLLITKSFYLFLMSLYQYIVVLILLDTKYRFYELERRESSKTKRTLGKR